MLLQDKSNRLVPYLLACVCLLAMLSVFLVNTAPLFYFDTFTYFEQGTSILKMIVPDTWLIELLPAPDAVGSGTAGGAGSGVETVNGSRSALFALVLAIFFQTHLLWAFPFLAALYIAATLWLLIRVATRQIDHAYPAWVLIGLPLLASSVGSLPFYISYLMPDILAPGLIVIAATLFAFGPQMRRAEIVGAAVLGLIAVLSHPSHLLIAGVLFGVFGFAALTTRRRGRWIVVLVLAALVTLGGAERLLFRSAVKNIAKSEVTYFPFLTARMIADGPGLRYLERHCPDPAITTCILFAALSKSDDPMRLTATHIVFELTPRLGSFRLMSQDDQKRVVEDQLNFVAAAVLDDPLGVVGGLLKNTVAQARLDSIQMTIPQPQQIAVAAARFPEAGLFEGRLILDQGWIPAVERFHHVINLVSLAIVLTLLVWPDRVATQIKLLALAILLGILANAFVCGAVSQPADRYGARVIWLLPMLASLLILFAWPRSRTQRHVP